MAQKNQRGNREAKKPKQNKVKAVASTLAVHRRCRAMPARAPRKRK